MVRRLALDCYRLRGSSARRRCPPHPPCARPSRCLLGNEVFHLWRVVLREHDKLLRIQADRLVGLKWERQAERHSAFAHSQTNCTARRDRAGGRSPRPARSPRERELRFAPSDVHACPRPQSCRGSPRRLSSGEVTVGVVSTGAMGSAAAAAYRAAGRDASSRRSLGEASERVGWPSRRGRTAPRPPRRRRHESELALSIAPPDWALAIAAGSPAPRTERRAAAPPGPDAVVPTTAGEVARTLVGAWLEPGDGSISGGPPRAHYRTRVASQACGLPRLAETGRPGSTSAWSGWRSALRRPAEMCTASVYKGHTALLAHALATAHAQRRPARGARRPPRLVPGPHRPSVRACRRLDDEGGALCRRDARDRRHAASAGLRPALFEAMAAVYSTARGDAARRRESPEPISESPQLEDVLEPIASDAGARTDLEGPEPTGTETRRVCQFRHARRNEQHSRAVVQSFPTSPRIPPGTRRG